MPLKNLTIGPANPASVSLLVSPLVLNGDLTINTGSTLDANVALNIPVTINGNFNNSGTYNPQKNTTTFNGNAQIINGSTPDIFYDLNVNPLTSLTLGGATTVLDNLTISSGTLICGGFQVSVSGNFKNNGTYTDNQVYGTGVSLVGSVLQHVAGSGAFSWLELNNPAGAVLDNSITIGVNSSNDNLTLTNGIFNLIQNLLTLQQNSIIEARGTPFSATKMVTTNGAFSNIGILKWFTTTPQTFFYPLGTSGKYTPLTFTFTASSNVGSLRINNINSTLPAVLNPTKALDYYWDVQSSGIYGFQGSLTFNYLAGDVEGSPESSYQTAWLIVPGTALSIGDPVFPASHSFTINYPAGTENLSGEYTAGFPIAFPANVPEYTSKQNGSWNDPNTWQQTNGDTHLLATGPNGFIVIIRNSDIVTANTNYCSAYKTTINGELKIVSPYYGHNLGTVDGNGTLYLESGTFPAGVYTSFFDCANNGTVEYGGTGLNYSIIADLYDHLPNMLFSGTGLRTMPDKVLTICNSFKINGPTVDDSYNPKLIIQGTMERYSTGVFECGTGANDTISFSGPSAQAIGGITGDFTGSNAFYNLEINNSAGLSVNTSGAVEVKGKLLLTNGLINTTTTNTVTISNTDVNCVVPTVGSATSYVNGPLTKNINQGDNFAFPIGTISGSTNVPGNRILVSSTQDGPLFWTAQYFGSNSTYSNHDGSLVAVSWDEYWSVKPSSASQAIINLGYYPNSDITPLVTQNGLPDMRVAAYNSGAMDCTNIDSFRG